MKVKRIIFYISFYIPEFIACIIHELAHWIIFFIGWCITANSFPKLVITGKAKQYVNEDNSTSINSWQMHIYIRERKIDNFIYQAIFFYAVLAPALATFILYLVSPWYMWLLYTPYLNTLWLSNKDIKLLEN